MRFTKENPRPGPGRPKDRLSIQDVVKRRLLEPVSKKIDMEKATNLEVVVELMMKNPKTMARICEWADPGLRIPAPIAPILNEPGGQVLVFNPSTITDKETRERLKALCRHVGSIDQPGDAGNGD